MRVSAALASGVIDGFAAVAADASAIGNGLPPARPPASRAARIATCLSFMNFLHCWGARALLGSAGLRTPPQGILAWCGRQAQRFAGQLRYRRNRHYGAGA